MADQVPTSIGTDDKLPKQKKDLKTSWYTKLFPEYEYSADTPTEE